MGRRGPRPTPTAELERRGTLKKSRRADEPEVAAGVPPKPDGLGEHGAALWDELAEPLAAAGVLTPLDGKALQLACRDWEEYHEHLTTLDEEGRILESKTGSKYQHPAEGMKNRALDRLRRWLIEFGLTPSSRSNVTATTPQKATGSLLKIHDECKV